MLTHVVADPAAYRPGTLGRELTLTLGWGAVSRLDLMPATCGDPDCEADHGYEGTVASDDISLRISADADGEAAVGQAMAFARGAVGEHRRAARLTAELRRDPDRAADAPRVRRRRTLAGRPARGRRAASGVRRYAAVPRR